MLAPSTHVRMVVHALKALTPRIPVSVLLALLVMTVKLVSMLSCNPFSVKRLILFARKDVLLVKLDFHQFIYMSALID
jgi:hypothetical protein